MEGEFKSLSLIHSLFPALVLEPFGYGQYECESNTHFILMEFLQIDSGLPDPEKLAVTISELHKRGTSPTGKFGFDGSNCHGRMVQEHYWDDSWCRYFTWLLDIYADEEIRVNGPYPEFEAAYAVLRKHVIPRLLEPLQADGQTLTPCLIHGDLWHENVGTNHETGKIVLYDPDAWYAHHEFELGIWRCDFTKFGREYLSAYLQQFPASEPKHEFEDRHRLYSLKFLISHSFHWPLATTRVRKM